MNQSNVRRFLDNFQELRFIVEGANVFFSDGARRHIATATRIKQIKDTTANKGGVFSSSIAEVLTAFLLGDGYEDKLLNDQATRWALTKDIMLLVERYAKEETEMLIRLHEARPEIPLFDLSQQSSEYIFALQAQLEKSLDRLLTDGPLIDTVLENYIPAVLVDRLGLAAIRTILDTPELQSYRNTIVTKKLASLAFYRFGADWDGFLERFSGDMASTLHSIVEE